MVSFNAAAGQTYLIRLTGWSSSENDFTLALSGPPCETGGSLPGDADGDGTVGILDFLIVLGNWGSCPAPCPPTCLGDVDGDCVVGITDFLIVLGNWS